jgi:tetratricopeptide (TPR) repeat protein
MGLDARTVRSLLVAALAATPAAAAQESAPAAEKPAAGAAAAASREAPTFEALHFAPGDLPKADWKLEAELACASTDGKALFEDGTPAGTSAIPKRKDFQTIGGPSGRGTLLVFEYPGGVPAEVVAAVREKLWAGGRTPSRLRPELFAHAGELLVVLSFPLTSPIKNWVAGRLRDRFGLRLPYESEDQAAALAPVLRAINAEDAYNGLAALKDGGEKLANSSFAAYLEAQFHEMKEYWSGADKAYARALELDATVDPLASDLLAWETTERRGNAIYQMGRHADAIPVIRAAADIAGRNGFKRERATSIYNVGCCLSLIGKTAEAIPCVAEAFELDPTLKTHARTDKDMDPLREMEEYKKISG